MAMPDEDDTLSCFHKVLPAYGVGSTSSSHDRNRNGRIAECVADILPEAWN